MEQPAFAPPLPQCCAWAWQARKFRPDGTLACNVCDGYPWGPPRGTAQSLFNAFGSAEQPAAK
eukprot:888936-Lingulodinium_polyedra.AAC.1